MTRFHYMDLTELATLIRTRKLSPLCWTQGIPTAAGIA